MFLSNSWHQTILSGLTHTFVIALLEIVLYFVYLTKKESEATISVLHGLADDINDYCVEKKSDPTANIFITNDEQRQNLQDMVNQYKATDNSTSDDNMKLVYIGIYILVGILGSIILVSIFLKPSGSKMFNWPMWKHILRDVIVSICFVAVFELVLINLIIMKYKLFSNNQVKYEIAKRLLDKGGCL